MNQTVSYSVDWVLLGWYIFYLGVFTLGPYWIIRLAVTHAVRVTDREWEERNP